VRALCICVVATALVVSRPDVRADAPVSVFFGNLHSHTALSDGSGTPSEAYSRARDVARLDFFAITEHNHADAGSIAANPILYTGPGSLSLIPTANSFVEEGEFVALYGQEFSSISKGNHVNVIDAPAVIDVPNGDFRALIQDWLPLHLDTQGQPPLLLLNHPTLGPDNKEYGIDDFPTTAAWLAALDPRAPLINLMNGPSDTPGTHLPPGDPSEDEYRRYLNLGLHVAPTADQDNHKPNWGDSTDARTAILAPSLTKAALLTAMRQRRAYATRDPNLRVVYRLNNELMGSRIQGAAVPLPGAALTVSLQIADDDEPTAAYVIEVFSDQVGGPVSATPTRTAAVTGNGTHMVSGVTYVGGQQFFYLRVKQGGVDTAWTAPVWLEPLGGGDGSGEFSMSLVVDPQAETARITNTGSSATTLTGWRLVSVRGNQVFDQFPSGFSLAPGASVTVTSGPAAKTGAGFLLWTNDNIWNNSGDPGRLLDADGELVTETS
jgi:hypothetical protein